MKPVAEVAGTHPFHTTRPGDTQATSFSLQKMLEKPQNFPHPNQNDHSVQLAWSASSRAQGDTALFYTQLHAHTAYMIFRSTPR